MPSDLIRRILLNYGEPFSSAPFVEHPSSGLSGARFWRSDIGSGRYVLRRWPDGQMTAPRLAWIHHVVDRAFSDGCRFLPVPLPTSGGSTFLEADDTYWQLEPWMPGDADLVDPPRFEKVAAAVDALARFHTVASDENVAGLPTKGRSPALAQRAELLDEIMKYGIEMILNAPAFLAPREPWTGIAMAARPWVDELLRRAHVMNVEIAEPLEVERPLQPVLRDVTRDHVLFTAERVTGLVDFGAMSRDCVAVDLARLAGSYGGDASIIDHICRSYQASTHASRLTNTDRQLVELLDRSGVLVAAYRWLRWVFVEERSFTDPQAVIRRIGKLISRECNVRKRS
jgi:Ser/Thr protein kinase RdoA (MazF antagonist)